MTETVSTGVQTDRTTATDEQDRSTASDEQDRITASEQPDGQAARASVRVVEAVADATNADPLAMAPLSAVIDPDALDCLLAAGLDGHVQFAYAGSDVTVRGDGTVVVADGEA